MKVELTISSNYVPDWTIADAVRELFQNALDQETADSDNKASWWYDPTTETLTISNKKSSLTTRSLLFGSTTKADDASMIGQFGEGYKLASLVLARNGKQITFLNYGEREVWKPRLVASRRFGTDILTYFIDRKHPWAAVPDDDLTIHIQGITQDEWDNEIVPTNLRLMKPYRIVDSTPIGDVLDLDKPGQIFVNGLYVCTCIEYAYSYDFEPGQLKLGRDRKLVSDFDLKWLASQIWARCTDSVILGRLLACDALDVRFVSDVYVPMDPMVNDDLHSVFIQRYGREAVPVSNQHEADSISRSCRSIIVPLGYKKMLERASTYKSPPPAERTPVYDPDLPVKQQLEEWRKVYSNLLTSEANEDLLAIIEGCDDDD